MRRSGFTLMLVVAVAVVLAAACVRTAPPSDSLDLSKSGPDAVDTTVVAFSRTLANGQTRTVQTHIWYPKTGGTASAPLPLIIFSHGSGARADLYSFFLSHLASHGFVVAGPDHEDCRAECTDQERQTADVNRPADISMILDGILARSASDDPLFKNLVDPQRVGIAGQSFGGWTALTVLAHDPRFRAGLAMNPGTIGHPYVDPRGLSKPLMLMAGALDAMTPYAFAADFFGGIPPSAPDHYLLLVQQAGHEFHNLCGNEFVTTGCASAMPQAQLQALVNRIGTAFLLREVAGRPLTDDQLGLHDASAEYQLYKAPADAPPVVPTARPLVAATATPGAAAGTVLFEDDLSRPDGGKLPATSLDPARYTMGYVGGTYEIAVDRTPGAGTALLPGTYANASIAVDVEMVNPTSTQFAQLACRSRDANSQYRFTFNPATGAVQIVRWLPVPGPNVPRLALLPLDTISSAMHLGGTMNHVELSCRNTTITARLNGVTIASLPDNSLAEGQMWIAAGDTAGGAGAGTRVTARFSNLVVRQE